MALGYVLIFKASGVFNFAQGAMVLTAALALVRALDMMQQEWKWPFGVALVCAFAFAAAVMALVASGVRAAGAAQAGEPGGHHPVHGHDRRHLLPRGPGADCFRPSDVYPLHIGLPKEPVFILESVFDGGILVNELDIWAAVIGGLLVAGLALLFPEDPDRPRAARRGRRDHAAAQSVGIPLNYIWFVVWLVAGLVALAAGAVWGSKLGVQFSLSLLALKALPVLILGGFTSVPGRRSSAV